MMGWFPRLADIPGIGYSGELGVVRTRLPGYNAKPTVEVYTYDGKQREILWWTAGEGKTTTSPARQYFSGHALRDETSETVIKHLKEALELPGQPADYHFSILGCIEELWAWKRRRREPWLLVEIEQFCLLDIRLIEALPEIIEFKQRGEKHYASVPAFSHLIHLYEREGFLEDALEVARRAARFNPDFSKLQELEQRIAELVSESSG